MSEVVRNSTKYVYLDIYGETADSIPTATVTTPDGVLRAVSVSADTAPAGVSQRWVVVLGLSDTQWAGEVRVDWSFEINGEEVTKTDWYDVVVPAVQISDIRGELDVPSEVSDADITKAERRVRRIIEKHCGQKFQKTRETLLVHANGGRMMVLPKRLISVDAVKDSRTDLTITGYELRNNNWMLRRTLQFYSGDTLTVTGPIFDPFKLGSYSWPRGVDFAIEGIWGWERVPEPVAEASLILIEQQLCPEAIYRERYLTSMKAADWRFDVSSSAFGGTGNVVADQLLSDYRVSNVVLV